VRVALTGLEQQLRPYHRGPGLDVELVRQAEDLMVLRGVIEVEDVLVVEQHLADDGLFLFQHRI